MSTIAQTRQPPATAVEAAAERDAAGPRRSRIWLAVAGLLVVQFGWLLVLPAHGGIDEFDHVYRASAVAHGEWAAEPSAAVRGTGAWVRASSDVVESARAECQFLPYTDDAECIGEDQGDGFTRIASGAGRYNPVFYALIGYPSLPFEGRAAVDAMRVTGALLAAGMFAGGLFALRRCRPHTWTWVGAAAALTPVVTYSTVVAAPNGLEILAGFAFWCACLALLHADEASPRRALLVTATISGCLLVSLRSLGPLWCLLIAGVAVTTVPGAWARLGRLVKTRGAQVCAAAIGAATVAAVLWTRAMSSLVIGVAPKEGLSLAEKTSETLQQLPLWVLQSIAAFPYRDEIAPMAVYACYLVVALFAIGLGLVRGQRGWVRGLVLALVLSLLVPGAIAYSTMETNFWSWQGRYGLPFAIGLSVLAGLGARRDVRLAQPLAMVLGMLAAISLSVSLVAVRARQVELSPSFDDGTWTAPPVVLLVVLAVLGTGLTWSLAWQRRRQP